MRQLSLDQLWLKLEDWRVSLHFKRVEASLRHEDVSHLPPTLQKAREQHLNQLHMYATRGIFPRNHEQPNYAPCFIDRDGRECAVAHLVMTSGQPDLAHKIAIAANYAYVPQMTFPELDTWAAQTGLSKKELALIQPGYYFSFEVSTMWLLFVTWSAALVTIVINTVQIARRRQNLVVPVIGLIIALILLMIGSYCLYSADLAYRTAIYADGWPGDLPLREVNPFIFSGFVSLGLALLTTGLALYRSKTFWRSANAIPQENLATE
jgi:hypothetical protein